MFIADNYQNLLGIPTTAESSCVRTSEIEPALMRSSDELNLGKFDQEGPAGPEIELKLDGPILMDTTNITYGRPLNEQGCTDSRARIFKDGSGKSDKFRILICRHSSHVFQVHGKQ